MSAYKLVAFKAPLNFRINKIVIAASFVGAKIEVSHISEIQDHEAWKLNCHPLGASPVLQTEHGYLFESGAIARFIARQSKQGLYGHTDFEASQVDSWLDYTTTELDIPTLNFLLSSIGFVNLSAEEAKQGNECIMNALEGADRWLEIRTFLVGERLTLADIALFSTLDIYLRTAPLAGDAYKLKNLIRWYLTVLHHPKVQEGLKSQGHEGLIPSKPKAEPAPAAPKKEEPKKEAKKEAKDDEEEEETFEEKKKPNPLDALPPSKLVLDEWKRTYSNNDTRKMAAPWFFSNWDAEGYTAFWANYKYNDENKAQFMTANLVRGWFQRMDHCRKYAFGVALIVGEDKKHEVTSFWIFRGKGLPEIVKEVDDTELFTWTEIPDINAEAAKITDYLAWDGETFKSKPCLEGRAFK